MKKKFIPRCDSSPNSKGFTLTELLLTLAVIFIVCAFCLPNYGKYYQVIDEKNAFKTLMIINTSLRVYRTIEGQYPPGELDLEEINQALDLGVFANGLTYTCLNTESAYFCRAISPHGWTLQADSLSNGVVHCFSGNCPRCTEASCPIKE